MVCFFLFLLRSIHILSITKPTFTKLSLHYNLFYNPRAHCKYTLTAQGMGCSRWKIVTNLYIHKDLYSVNGLKSIMNICISIGTFYEDIISRRKNILIKLSKTLSNPEKAHSFQNPPCAPPVKCIRWQSTAPSMSRMSLRSNFVYKGN